MTVKQIPVKISAVIVDWDGTVTARMPRPILDFPIRLFAEAINTHQEIEYQRGTRSPLPNASCRTVDILTQNTPLRKRHSPIVKLLETLSQKNLPWFIVSDHSTRQKLKPYPKLKPMSQISCRNYALKPLSDAFHAVLCQLSSPRHEFLYIGDREDTDGLACEQIGIPFISIDSLTHDLVKDIILRF